MTRRSVVLALVVAASTSLVVATGCQTEIIIDDGTTSGSGATTGVTTSVGSTSVTTGSGPNCAAFSDSEGPSPVTVLITNSSPQPIFLPANCVGEPVLGISPTTGPDGNTYAYDGSCLQTCADLQKEPQFDCGACAPASIMIPSGGSREFIWDGTALSSATQMPASCWFAPQEASSCVQKLGAPSQAYAFGVQGFAECGDGTGSCACTPDGHCGGDPKGQEAFANPAKINYPSEAKVEILFDICAFGCAEPFN